MISLTKINHSSSPIHLVFLYWSNLHQMSLKHLAIESSAMTTAHEDCSAKKFLSGATDLRNGVLTQLLRAGNKMRNIVLNHRSKMWQPHLVDTYLRLLILNSVCLINDDIPPGKLLKHCFLSYHHLIRCYTSVPLSREHGVWDKCCLKIYNSTLT